MRFDEIALAVTCTIAVTPFIRARCFGPNTFVYVLKWKYSQIFVNLKIFPVTIRACLLSPSLYQGINRRTNMCIQNRILTNTTCPHTMMDGPISIIVSTTILNLQILKAFLSVNFVQFVSVPWCTTFLIYCRRFSSLTIVILVLYVVLHYVILQAYSSTAPMILTSRKTRRIIKKSYADWLDVTEI
jgi:hypothetical protein